MYDESKVKLSYTSIGKRIKKGEIKDFLYNDVLFTAKRKDASTVYYDGNYNNLKLQIKNEHLYISNSLHKFAIGNNYDDFGYSDLYDTIHELNEFTNGEYFNGTLQQIAYGVNLTENFFNNWSMLRGNKFDTYPQKKSNSENKFLKFTDYRVKGYDKSIESNLSYPLFRIEKTVTSMRHLRSRGINISKPKILLNKDIIIDVMNDLINDMDAIIYRPVLNLDEINTFAQYKEFLAIENLYRLPVSMQKDFERSIRRLKRKVIQDSNIKSKLKVLIREKFEQFLST